MPPIQATGKRFALPIEKKVEILEEIDKKRSSKSEIARQFNIPTSTLFTIIKNRDKILKIKENGVAPGRVRTTEGKNPQLEKALVTWLETVRSKNVPVDGNILKAKAETFALRMNLNDFKASDGWMQKFKLRHGLSFRKLCGESASVNMDTVNEWKEGKLKDLISTYDPKDVFNADETGLFFKLLPDRTLVLKGQSCSGGKLSKERVTVLLAANMTGSEKLPLLVIGKSKQPRCFKGIRSLPTGYRNNKKAWMTRVIYEEWIRELDRKMAFQGRKILLVVDNCTAHANVQDLKAVKIAFLPPNVTSVLQPLDQGIIQNFKKNYRRMLLDRIVLCIDNDKTYEVTLLSAIHLANAAWIKVSKETIANCFRHAGFQVNNASAEATEAEVAVAPGIITDRRDSDELLLSKLKERLQLPDDLQFEDYADVDASVECSEELELTEENILKRFTEKEDDENNISSDDDDDDRPEDVKPSCKQASEAVEVLRKYYEREHGAEKFLTTIMDMENDILQSSQQQLKQSRITDFMTSNK